MAGDLLIFGLEVVAVVTIALLAVFLLRGPVRSLFGARAAYCLWLLVPTMVAAIALPRAAAPEPTAAAEPAVAASLVNAETPAPTAAGPVALPERPDFLPNPVDLATPLLLLWILGVIVFAALLARNQSRFLRSLGPLRIERRADGVLFHAERSDVGPALVGALTPRVVLPGDFAERFSPEEQVVVVAHERAHLAGGDAQINLAIAAVRTLLWFHPLIHFAARLIRADQELACDETVVTRHPGARRVYAEAMLKTQFCGVPTPLGCHWLAGGKPELQRRIIRLTLAPGRGRRAAGAAVAVVLAATGGAAAWAAQPASELQSADAPPPVSAATRDLIAAIRNGRNTHAAELVRDGADVNGWRPGDGSPLILAVRDGQLELARLLLDSGARPDLSVPGEGAPLIVAADNGDLDMVSLLLERGADPDLPVQGDGNPLIAASAAGHLEVVDLLLAAGATIDAIVPSDETALITAARLGHLPVVKRLVEKGADVNLAVMAPRLEPLRPELRSPLGMARRAGRRDIVDYLTAHGARA